MSQPISLTDLRAEAEANGSRTITLDGKPVIAHRYASWREVLALVDAVEAAHAQLLATEAWSAAQDHNAFADQVRQWAMRQRAKLTARFAFAPDPDNPNQPTDLRCLNDKHTWDYMQDGYIHCDRCPARHAITADEAIAFTFTGGPLPEWLRQ